MKALLLARAVLHADETPVPMLKPGLGRTHRAYLWSYSSSEYDELQTVIYEFTEVASCGLVNACVRQIELRALHLLVRPGVRQDDCAWAPIRPGSTFMSTVFVPAEASSKRGLIRR